MRVISMFLGDKEIARIEEEGNLKVMIEFNGEFKPPLRQWYDDCFYGINNVPTSTFDDRFRLAEENNYFCYSKPALKLIARTLP